MKVMFISDIHGLKTNIDLVKNKYINLKCDKIVVLGDLYYNYASNYVKGDYDPKYIDNFLNEFKDSLICMRGNCDSNLDVKKSNFPIYEDVFLMKINDLDIYITHGNLYNYNNPNNLSENCILIYGHEHIPYIKARDNRIFINTGSISLPRDNNMPSYTIYENHEFTIYDINGKIIDKISL